MKKVNPASPALTELNRAGDVAEGGTTTAEALSERRADDDETTVNGDGVVTGLSSDGSNGSNESGNMDTEKTWNREGFITVMSQSTDSEDE